jgi:dTDP-4-dehydrorhamnose reductase
MTNVLVIGGAGQVGIELRRLVWPGDVAIHAPSRAELDLADPGSIAAFFAGRRHDVVINAGAYTAVDKAEQEPVTAFAINALGACGIAECTRRAGVPMVHVSTDAVFDGRKSGVYEEHDPVCPINVYGASKTAGEHAVRTVNPRSVILRTAWLVSPHRANFARTILRLAAEQPRLRVVSDQHGCPTVAVDLAAALATIALKLANDIAAPTGTYHFVNGGGTTWHGLAEAILRRAAHHGWIVPPLDAIATSEYPMAAARPPNSSLSTSKLTRDFGIKPRPWLAAVNQTVDALIGADKGS